jgi:hypothetical protein
LIVCPWCWRSLVGYLFLMPLYVKLLGFHPKCPFHRIGIGRREGILQRKTVLSPRDHRVGGLQALNFRQELVAEARRGMCVEHDPWLALPKLAPRSISAEVRSGSWGNLRAVSCQALGSSRVVRLSRQ